MAQRTYRRLFVLLVAGVLMATLWLAVGAGCEGTRTTTLPPPDRDEVRRLATAVWAGSPGNSPPLLGDGNWKDLYAGDSVRTDQFGEAELRLVGCDGSVWVFDNSSLSVWKCTKQAEAEKEGWCIEEGSAGFNTMCAARFDIVDTPSAQVNIRATAFSVSFVPDRRLTLVTVLRGVVEVAPVINTDTLEIGEPEPVRAGYFLYTMPGERSPEISAVEARTPQPLYKLPLIVDELGIRDWMDDITRWGDSQGLLEPNVWPFLGLILDFDGGQLEDPRVQEAFVTAIDRKAVLNQAFPDEEVEFTAVIDNEPRDAFTIPYDPEGATAWLAEAGYDYGQLVTVIFPGDDDQTVTAAKWIAGQLSLVDIEVKLAPLSWTEMIKAREKLAAGGNAVLSVYR